VAAADNFSALRLAGHRKLDLENWLKSFSSERLGQDLETEVELHIRIQITHI